MVLARKRKLSESLANTVCSQVCKEGAEVDFFKLLCRKHWADSVAEIESIQFEIQSFSDRKMFEAFSLKEKQFTLRFEHIFLMDLCIVGPRPDPVSDLIDLSVVALDRSVVEECLQDLIAEGHLKQTPDGFVREKESLLIKGHASTEIRNIQKTLIGLGADSIDRNPPSMREVGCRSVWARESRIMEAKKMAEEFRFKLAHFLEDESGDDQLHEAVCLYQLNIQLFPMIRHSVSRGRSKE